ncbi:hypothetical protein RDV78_04010 [Bacillota bacterium LX-D]|nr:hypothetical protein [Bacillota bacterium LX-D]
MDNSKMVEFLPRLNGFIPITGEDGGNYTEIWLKGPEKIQISKKSKTVLAHLVRLYAKDLVLVRQQSKRILGYSKDLPLLITHHLVLIPVKVREATYKDEGTLGYVVLQSVDKVRPLERGKAKLSFQDGSELLVLNRVQKIRQKMNEALDLIRVEMDLQKLFYQANLNQAREDFNF